MTRHQNSHRHHNRSNPRYEPPIECYESEPRDCERERLPNARKRRQDRTEVSCCIKYLVFGFNVFFWVLGGLIFAAGVWAWTEKDTFANLSRLTELSLDPALTFIIAGGVMFVIGFSGCVGALRENTCLLAFFCVLVGLILLGELVIGILGFVYKDWVRNKIEDQLKRMLMDYREDVDLQNLIDWVQNNWLRCCGVTDYTDWQLNMYFNCSSPGAEACGVPFSCCKPTDAAMENRLCGYSMLKPDMSITREQTVYTSGCIPSGEQWLNDNLIPVAGVLVGIAVLQILGMCFAYNLRSDVLAQKEKWNYQ